MNEYQNNGQSSHFKVERHFPEKNHLKFHATFDSKVQHIVSLPGPPFIFRLWFLTSNEVKGHFS